ncbi:threonine/serine exporter family protein [Nonomuraea wenchangensis]|uniref:threonine/serine exporter family protein n=1 Tax=Nonomuraea wenchangensis TaxID=568860 RepID=UPI0037999539
MMTFILDLGEQMFMAGTDTRSIEVSVVAVAASFGLSPFEFTIVGRTIIVQYAPQDREPQIMMRVARTVDSRDLHRAVKIYRLVEDIVQHDVELSSAERTLRGIKRLQPRWPWWAQLAGRAVLVSSVTLQADGTPEGVLFAMGVLIVVDRAGWALARGGIPGYYVTFVQAALVAGLGILALNLEVLSVRAYASATAANLVLLLPVRSVVSLAQDAITQFGTLAAVRPSPP